MAKKSRNELIETVISKSFHYSYKEWLFDAYKLDNEALENFIELVKKDMETKKPAGTLRSAENLITILNHVPDNNPSIEVFKAALGQFGIVPEHYFEWIKDVPNEKNAVWSWRLEAARLPTVPDLDTDYLISVRNYMTRIFKPLVNKLNSELWVRSHQGQTIIYMPYIP